MERDDGCRDVAFIERGKVSAVDNGGTYTVTSYGRDGLEVSGIAALAGGPYTVGEKVYFFVFDDGRGGIIGRFA